MQTSMARNVSLMPWYGFLRNLAFWQATWFLFFQHELSAAEAILLYVVFDISATIFEVPSGWMSDRIGRRVTLILSAFAGALGAGLLALGEGFTLFAVAQALLGLQMALVSGTDSSMLYESLAADDRAGEVEGQELRLWRFSFTALAFSALTGGWVALYDPALPFAASAVASLGLLALALCFKEPPHAKTRAETGVLHLQSLRPAFRNPTLLWLFALGVLMYAFSHVPFVFGQPFIEAVLNNLGLDANAPLISGAVTCAMMLLSVLVSMAAPRLRARLGLGPMLLFAFGVQIGLVAVLALSNAPWIILFLLMRMVPDSLSKPFILARIQPLLQDDSRATFLSLRSLGGRLLLAVSLFVASGSASQVGDMALSEISGVLTWYAVAGLLVWLCFLATARQAALDPVDVSKRA